MQAVPGQQHKTKMQATNPNLEHLAGQRGCEVEGVRGWVVQLALLHLLRGNAGPNHGVPDAVADVHVHGLPIATSISSWTALFDSCSVSVAAGAHELRKMMLRMVTVKPAATQRKPVM